MPEIFLIFIYRGWSQGFLWRDFSFFSKSKPGSKLYIKQDDSLKDNFNQYLLIKLLALAITTL